MSSLRLHPEDGVLLRCVDGELSGRKGRQVGRHLEACWQCRTEAGELERTIADCVRYRREVLQIHLPPPPRPWADLDREFARIDRGLAEKSFFRNLFRPWALAAAAAVLMSIGIFYQLHHTPAVQAAALLQRAVSAAGAHPLPARRIQIRTRSRQFTRTIGGHAVVSEQPADLAALAAMFAAAHYDWRDPLSARSYAEWRNSLSEKHDEVSTTGDSYRIRTSTDAGELASASLTLRATDLRPVESRLEFRGANGATPDWIELTDITDASPDNGAPVETNVEAPPRRVVPSTPAVSAPGPAASISEELQVLSALHQIGADLGDPIEIIRSGGRVLVTGIGIPPERQQQIRTALGAVPDASVTFEDAVPAPAPPEPANAAPAAAAGSPAPGGLQDRLEKQLGSHAGFERLSSQLLDWNEAAMARAYALRALSQRFPAESEAALDPAERRALRAMAREHAAAFAQQSAAIGRTLAPVLTALGGSAGSAAPAPAASTWQAASEQLFRDSRRVEVLLSVLLGVAPGIPSGSGPVDRLPSDLLASMSQLRIDLDQCQRLLSSE